MLVHGIEAVVEDLVDGDGGSICATLQDATASLSSGELLLFLGNPELILRPYR
jgi:hypothetical protein